MAIGSPHLLPLKSADVLQTRRDPARYRPAVLVVVAARCSSAPSSAR
jgi:hypothetical protein